MSDGSKSDEEASRAWASRLHSPRTPREIYHHSQYGIIGSKRSSHKQVISGHRSLSGDGPGSGSTPGQEVTAMSFSRGSEHTATQLAPHRPASGGESQIYTGRPPPTWSHSKIDLPPRTPVSIATQSTGGNSRVLNPAIAPQSLHRRFPSQNSPSHSTKSAHTDCNEFNQSRVLQPPAVLVECNTPSGLRLLAPSEGSARSCPDTAAFSDHDASPPTIGRSSTNGTNAMSVITSGHQAATEIMEVTESTATMFHSEQERKRLSLLLYRKCTSKALALHVFKREGRDGEKADSDQAKWTSFLEGVASKLNGGLRNWAGWQQNLKLLLPPRNFESLDPPVFTATAEYKPLLLVYRNKNNLSYVELGEDLQESEVGALLHHLRPPL